MRFWKSIGLGVIAVLIPGLAAANDSSVFFELTLADSTISYSDSAAWGWWNRDKYDDWLPEKDSASGVVGARLLSSGEKYVLLLAGEWYPDLGVNATRTDPESGDQTSHALDGDIEVYDLGYGRWFGEASGFEAMPWGAITHMRIGESRSVLSDPPTTSDGSKDEASSHLWGVGVGADFRVSVARSLSATGRVVVRWARGDRDAWVSSGSPDNGAPEEANVKLTDSTSRAMYGVELGIRWLAMRQLAVEGGWWYRDWAVDDGPATFDGPFVRVTVGF